VRWRYGEEENADRVIGYGEDQGGYAFEGGDEGDEGNGAEEEG
jgi:hypothetical protein